MEDARLHCSGRLERVRLRIASSLGRLAQFWQHVLEGVSEFLKFPHGTYVVFLNLLKRL
jgi:hypothetical protein